MINLKQISQTCIGLFITTSLLVGCNSGSGPSSSSGNSNNISSLASAQLDSVKQQSNNVTLLPYSDATTSIAVAGFTESGHSITSGQPYAGISLSAPNTLTILAGRDGSTTPVDYLASLNFPINSNPQNLNFAVNGSLLLNVTTPAFSGQLTCNNIAIGQGSNAISNDWWMWSNIPQSFNGGINISHNQTSILTISCVNNQNQSFTVGIQSSATTDNSFSFTSILRDNWMGALPPGTKLNQITMPGSHDAGMSAPLSHCDPDIPLVTSSQTQTQNLNILGQAEAGSRYFDIRVDYDHNQLVTYHRNDKYGALGCDGEALSDVLDNAVTFLQNHPSETLILKFSHTRNFNDYIGTAHSETITVPLVLNMLRGESYASYLYKTDPLTNIAELTTTDTAGKIVAVFDGNDPTPEYAPYYNAPNGILAYSNVPESGPSEYTIIPNLNVYDWYADTSDFSTMEADEVSKLLNYAGLNQLYLFSFSWTITGGVILDNAAKANSMLPAELSQIMSPTKSGTQYPQPNIVYMDDVNPATSNTVIEYNFVNK